MISQWRKKQPRPHDDPLMTINSSCIYLGNLVQCSILHIHQGIIYIRVSSSLFSLSPPAFAWPLFRSRSTASRIISHISPHSFANGKCLLTTPNRSLHLLKHSLLIFWLVDRWASPIMSIIRRQQAGRSRSLAHPRMSGQRHGRRHSTVCKSIWSQFRRVGVRVSR